MATWLAIAGLVDPFGHHWSVGTQIRAMSMKEVQQAMQEASALPPTGFLDLDRLWEIAWNPRSNSPPRWRSRAGVPRPGAEAHGSETGARVTPPRPSLPRRRTLGVSADAFLRRMHGMFEYRLSTGAIASRIPDSQLEDE